MNVIITKASAQTLTTITVAPAPTLAQLRTAWHKIASKANGKRAAAAQAGVNVANQSGAAHGTAAWYATAIARFNQG